MRMEEGGSNTNVQRDHPNGSLHSMNYTIDESVITENSRYSLSQDSLYMTQELLAPEGRVPGKDYKAPISKQGLHRPPLFSAKELRSSIIASESSRIMCSVSIALVVVLSYIDSPLLGINIVNSKSIIALRPLYMLIVTEITVIITFLVLERRRFQASDNDAWFWNGGGVNWERAEMLLEGGLVAHQTMRAVFIDLSIYGVLVICCLSLVTRV